MHVITQSKLTLLLWRHTERTTRIRVNVWINHAFSMNVTHAHEIVTGLIGLGMETLKIQDWIEFSWRTTVYIAKFNVKPRLEHEFPIE